MDKVFICILFVLTMAFNFSCANGDSDPIQPESDRSIQNFPGNPDILFGEVVDNQPVGFYNDVDLAGLQAKAWPGFYEGGEPVFSLGFGSAAVTLRRDEADPLQ